MNNSFLIVFFYVKGFVECFTKDLIVNLSSKVITKEGTLFCAAQHCIFIMFFVHQLEKPMDRVFIDLMQVGGGKREYLGGTGGGGAKNETPLSATTNRREYLFFQFMD